MKLKRGNQFGATILRSSEEATVIFVPISVCLGARFVQHTVPLIDSNGNRTTKDLNRRAFVCSVKQHNAIAIKVPYDL